MAKKDASVQSRSSWKNLRFKKIEESLAKPSTFLWFHNIYAYFISILRGALTLDGCPHIETRKLMPTRTRTPSFASGATERQEIFSSSLTSLRGATKQRWRHPPGDPNFARRFGCITIQLGLLLSTWETCHGWWFTSKYWKSLRFQLQRYRCPERRKMGFSLASGVLQRSDLHWPWSAPKKRLMGMVHKESPERTAMCLWHIETLHQLTAPMEMSVVCN